MILGILGILLAIVLIGVPLAWVGLILGIISLVQINSARRNSAAKVSRSPASSPAHGPHCIDAPAPGHSPALPGQGPGTLQPLGLHANIPASPKHERLCRRFRDDYPVMPFKRISPSMPARHHHRLGIGRRCLLAMYAPPVPSPGSTLAGPWVLRAPRRCCRQVLPLPNRM